MINTFCTGKYKKDAVKGYTGQEEDIWICKKTLNEGFDA